MPKVKEFVGGWSDLDLAWLSGLYEGEGCLSKQMKTKHGYWVLGVTMTDEDVIREAHRIAGVGSSFGPMLCPSLAAYKPTYRWVVNAQQHIYVLTKAMLPWLKVRRSARIAEFHREFEAKNAHSGFCNKGVHETEQRGRCRLCVNAGVRAWRAKQKLAST